MRIVSQDERYDLPYDKIALCISAKIERELSRTAKIRYKIIASGIDGADNRVWEMARYESLSTAQYVCNKLRDRNRAFDTNRKDEYFIFPPESDELLKMADEWCKREDKLRKPTSGVQDEDSRNLQAPEKAKRQADGGQKTVGEVIDESLHSDL